MTSRHGYVTTWDILLLVGIGQKKTGEIIKIKICMSQLGAAGSNGLISSSLQLFVCDADTVGAVSTYDSAITLHLSSVEVNYCNVNSCWHFNVTFARYQLRAKCEK